MFGKYFNKQYVNFKRLSVLLIIGIIIISVFFSAFEINAYRRKIAYCETNREYIKVYVDAAMQGKMDDGKPQKDSSGNLIIDFNNSSCKTTVNYRGKETDCFKLVGFGGEYNLIFGLEDIRGDFLNEKSELKSQPFYSYFVNGEIPVCPFSNEKEPHYYCILEDGTVVCTCPKCQ